VTQCLASPTHRYDVAKFVLKNDDDDDDEDDVIRGLHPYLKV